MQAANKSDRKKMEEIIKWVLDKSPSDLLNRTIQASDYYDENQDDSTEIIRVSSPKKKKSEKRMERVKKAIQNMEFSDDGKK